MASSAEQLKKVLAGPMDAPVYYLASTEAEVLRQAAGRVRAALLKNGTDSETTRVDGPVPNLGEVVAAAGAISFFGTRRLVEIWELSPSTVKDKDAEELAALFTEVENAVLLVTALYKDKKTATSKKAKLLFTAAQQAGFAAQLEKLSRRELAAAAEEAAAALGARFAPGAAMSLVERAGEDSALLQTEAEKLAAYCNYGTIDEAAVAQVGAHNIEADVFELARHITAGNRANAQQKLADLLALRHEPVAITAALAGTFVDMLRVRLGSEKSVPVAGVFKDFGYYGSDWRLQKARDSARRYTTPALQGCVLCLAKLDRQLKSSALPDKTPLLQAAVGRLLLYGGAR